MVVFENRVSAGKVSPALERADTLLRCRPMELGSSRERTVPIAYYSDVITNASRAPPILRLSLLDHNWLLKRQLDRPRATSARLGDTLSSDVRTGGTSKLPEAGENAKVP